MTRRADPALRVIPLHGKSWSTAIANLLGARVSNTKVLFQIKARSMVHTGGPGTFVWCLNFCFEVFPESRDFSEK